MRFIIRGTVQGVGFRPAVYRAAEAVGARGTVRNDGSCVTIDADRGEELLAELLRNLPPLARIESIERRERDLDPSAEGFSITESEDDASLGAPIPADTAVCPECLADMRSGRRTGYPFTTCTGCGPRFTLLRSLPYDRRRTAMDAFPMCPACGREYADPGDRRFHHQTVCCPECGPRYRLLDRSGGEVPGEPVGRFAEMLGEGGIGVAKSWGGMHICCILSETARMRKWYRREQKPFAIMARDVEAARRYCRPTDEEVEVLQSPHRPIVLAEKRRGGVTELVSPGLGNIGVFLPYAGVQHLLFDALKEDALVMTSANAPGEPMIIGDGDVMGLGADMYLLHDQEIVNRADDSVLRMFGADTFYIRKSRGSVPSFYDVPWKGSAAAVGAQESLAGAVAAGGRICPTQHIGDGGGLGVPEYLEEAVRLQMELTGCVPQIVAEDLHPGYANRRFARRLAEECGAELIDVQHHWAHAASLMVDRGDVEHIAAIAVDGTGHGDDGMAWGGEVLSCGFDSYRRCAHLQYIPLLGSERALHDLRRLRFAIDEMNGEENSSFGEGEAEVLRRLMPKSVGASSFGRVLDAIAYSAGVCERRTYDGEPAMKLEPLLARGRLIDGFGTGTSNGVIETARLFPLIDAEENKADAAYSAVRGILSEMVSAAAEAAEAEGEGRIGITGGVSYDVPIARMAKELAGERGMELVVHGRVPNGDGGISTGQAAIALRRLRAPGVGACLHCLHGLSIRRTIHPSIGDGHAPGRRTRSDPMANTLFVLLDGLEDDPNPALGGRKPYEVADMPFIRGRAPHLNTTDGRGYTELFLNEFWTGHPPRTPRAALEAQGLGMDMRPGRMAFRMSPAYIRGGTVHWAYGVDDLADDLAAAVRGNMHLLDGRSPQIEFFVHGRAVITMYWDCGIPDTPSPPADGAYVPIEGELGQLVARVADEMDGLTLYPWACGFKAEVDPPFPGIGRMTAVSDSPTALGVAATLGHRVCNVPEMSDRFPVARRALREGNVFLHIDEVDEYSHRKDCRRKIAVLEETDALMREYFDDNPRMVFFADHGTSCVTGEHILTAVPFRTNVPIGDGKHFALPEVVPKVLGAGT